MPSIPCIDLLAACISDRSISSCGSQKLRQGRCAPAQRMRHPGLCAVARALSDPSRARVPGCGVGTGMKNLGSTPDPPCWPASDVFARHGARLPNQLIVPPARCPPCVRLRAEVHCELALGAQRRFWTVNRHRIFGRSRGFRLFWRLRDKRRPKTPLRPQFLGTSYLRICKHRRWQCQPSI
jgi:hypothetical protein